MIREPGNLPVGSRIPSPRGERAIFVWQKSGKPLSGQNRDPRGSLVGLLSSLLFHLLGLLLLIRLIGSPGLFPSRPLPLLELRPATLALTEPIPPPIQPAPPPADMDRSEMKPPDLVLPDEAIIPDDESAPVPEMVEEPAPPDNSGELAPDYGHGIRALRVQASMNQSRAVGKDDSLGGDGGSKTSSPGAPGGDGNPQSHPGFHRIPAPGGRCKTPGHYRGQGLLVHLRIS